mgnify:CR=1 FL=1
MVTLRAFKRWVIWTEGHTSHTLKPTPATHQASSSWTSKGFLGLEVAVATAASACLFTLRMWRC